MQKPTGLKLYRGIWHIDKVVKVGHQRQRIRGSTGFREDELKEAAQALAEKVEVVEKTLLAKLEHTFAEAAVKYVTSLERRGKDTAQALRDFKKLMPFIGGLPLSHVHQDTLSAFEQHERNRGINSGTVDRTYHTLLSVLHHAARVLRDGNEPWLRYSVPKIVSPDWEDARAPYRLTWDEQDRLVATLPDALVPIVLFALSTGAREQEIVSLRWDKVVHADGLPKHAVWWVPPSIRKKNAKKRSSEQEGRYLVCNHIARSVIEGQIGKDKEWVFPSPKGGRYLRANNNGFRSARKKAGVPCRFHDLRHTFGERLASAGVPWEYRKVLLGHTLKDITAHYSAPGLVKLVEMADLVTRENSPSLRPVVAKRHNMN